MKMLALFFVLATPCFARLGETRDQCDTRYGTPTTSTPASSRHEKNGITVDIRYFEGKATRVRLSKETAGLGERLTDIQVSELLKANSNGLAWELFSSDTNGKKLILKDGSAHASWDYTAGALALITPAQIKRDQENLELARIAARKALADEAVRKAQAEKNTTTGF